MRFRRKRNLPVDWQSAPDVKARTLKLVKDLELTWVKSESLYFYRSANSSARAYARIWGLPRIWQLAIKSGPKYIIEVLSEKYDPLSDKEKDKVLLHEITHIPRNFSGSLMPHIRQRGKRNFHGKVEDLIREYLRKSNI